jgi:hypothetical protein
LNHTRNSCHNSKLLLNLDEVAIQKTYQFKLDTWIFNLREALHQYLECVRKEKRAVLDGTLSTLSDRMVAGYCLCSLIECTKAFAGLLTPEAKESLQNAIFQRVEKSISVWH